MTGWPASRPQAPVVRRIPSPRVPGESAEYRAARNRLLDQEIDLRRAIEAVAEARRRLSPGGVVPERSRDFYHNVLGAEIVRDRDPVILRFHNG
jgi:hypothetical protein